MLYTRYSSVLGISNIDFTPADITATGVLPSSVRSEDISMAAQKYQRERKVIIRTWVLLAIAQFSSQHFCTNHSV